MERAISGFHQDEAQDWVAELVCGHRRHVRHDPPLVERPWVLTEEERHERIGSVLDCTGCDRRALPEHFVPYRRTPDFDQTTIPEALRKQHETKTGVWGLIHVVRGSVTYRIEAPFHSSEILGPGAPGVVLPEVRHQLLAAGPVTLYVEFWRAPD